MKRALALIFIVALLATAGCANLTPRQQRALSGGTMGAAGGAALGAITGGSPALGAPPLGPPLVEPLGRQRGR